MLTIRANELRARREAADLDYGQLAECAAEVGRRHRQGAAAQVDVATLRADLERIEAAESGLLDGSVVGYIAHALGCRARHIARVHHARAYVDGTALRGART